MAQRPRISQLKRTDQNYRTFYEQYSELEREAEHFREPVLTRGELPWLDNRDGDICMVKSERVIYTWDESLQNWTPVLGKNYDVPSGTIKRYKQVYKAQGGETSVPLNFRYDVGNGTLDVYQNGILQDAGEDYIEVDENTVEFLDPLPKGMKVIFITPYVVGETRNVTDLEKRLESIEYNHYQLMLVQYYSGKPVQAQGLAFDGFVNTSRIDYGKTTSSVVYDSANRTVSLSVQTVSKFTDSFDTAGMKNAVLSTVRQVNSEITLPIKTTFSTAFEDSFEDKSKIASGSDVFHDVTKELITTDSKYSGGDHYFMGDFMGTTDNAEKKGYNSGGDGGNSMARSIFHTPGYVGIVHNNNTYHPVWLTNLTNNTWTSWLSRYVNPNRYYDFGNIVYSNVDKGSITGIAGKNRLYGLYWYSQGNNRYYQQIFESPANIMYSSMSSGWVAKSMPSGLPPEIAITSATERIIQIGSTKTQLLLRSQTKVFFVNVDTWTVAKELDFTGMKIPSTWNYNSMQFTADARYLYFTNYNSSKGFFVEVYDINTGEHIQDVSITGSNPYSSAIAFEWDNHRLIVSMRGNYHYTLNGKELNTYTTVDNYYPAIVLFDSPNVGFYTLQSKPFYTNLPTVHYKLNVTQQLNGGVIEYYIRFGSEAWQKINPNTGYTWNNPKNKSEEVSVQLRARMRVQVGTSTSPILQDWSLQVRAFAEEAIYVSIAQQLGLDGVTGGKLETDETVPAETTLQWTVQLDDDNSEIVVSDTGYFSTPDDMVSSNTVVRGKLSTNNELMSPVARDVKMNLYYAEGGVLESNIYHQLEEIQNATVWVTSGTASSYYSLHLSRDGGDTWIDGVKEESLQLQNGTQEVKYHFVFKGAEKERQKLKLKIVMNGATEIHQYGVMINPNA